MKKLKNVLVPKGWERRNETSWKLKADKGASQPLIAYISSFDRNVDYSGKTGYQCTLGEFAGRYCYVAPLQSDKDDAITDCYDFMREYKDKDKLKSFLNRCDVINPYHRMILV